MAERRAATRARLDTPLAPRRGLPRPHYDPEAFGRFSETIARFIGTARFLVIQTGVIIVWIAWNVAVPDEWRFDDYPFQFLTLVLSLQAAYAAPLILLAQNRQADRDRVNLEEDRQRADRSVADTEYLTREVASLRVAVGEVATRDFLRDQLREMTEEVVARATEGADAAIYDRQARERREDRERRAERKKRRDHRTDEPAPVGSSLGEPFVGGEDKG